MRFASLSNILRSKKLIGAGGSDRSVSAGPRDLPKNLAKVRTMRMGQYNRALQ